MAQGFGLQPDGAHQFFYLVFGLVVSHRGLTYLFLSFRYVVDRVAESSTHPPSAVLGWLFIRSCECQEASGQLKTACAMQSTNWYDEAVS